MTELAVSRREIRRIQSGLADDIAARERTLAQELPVDAPANVPARLRALVDNWESGRKSLRTVPVCNVYAAHCGREVPASVKRSLTGLDATINVLDDIIDTRELEKETKIALTINAAFSGVMLVENCPADAREDVSELLFDYYTSVFQIPLVERELLERMRSASFPAERRDAASSLYAYRARDIDAFARFPAVVMGVDEQTEQRLVDDLRAYRCRRLLFKDIADVERDLADEDRTPIIQLLESCDTTEEVVGEIEELYADFDYSEAGRQEYCDLLFELENAPEDLHEVVSRARAMLPEAAV